MQISRVLIANRNEIAVRIARTCSLMGLESVAICSTDEAEAPHGAATDRKVVLPGVGTAAYLSIPDVVQAALDTGCDAVHPGYGFLSENPDFAKACADAGLVLVGPSAQLLELFGDKTAARELAERCGVPVLRGTGVATVEDARRLLADLGPGQGVMVKALAGGGGRGTRAVFDAALLDEAFATCAAEALSSFGNGDLYVEQLMSPARHIEVQVVGDGTGDVRHLGERDCSLQRRHQKLVEISPAPGLDPGTQERLRRYALAMAAEVRYASVGTFEFLVGKSADGSDDVVFLETNPRLQVEHTVTEEVWGVDLVELQLRVASGERLADLRLPDADESAPDGTAIQLRIIAETMAADGSSRPAVGTVESVNFGGGPGVRIDHAITPGMKPSPLYDPLLAKLIVHAKTGGFDTALTLAQRALSECRFDGVETNKGFLAAILELDDVRGQRLDVSTVDTNRAALLERAAEWDAARVERTSRIPDSADSKVTEVVGTQQAVPSPVAGLVVSVSVTPGDHVAAGQELMVLEAMKMQYPIQAPASGTAVSVLPTVGTVVEEGGTLVVFEPSDSSETVEESGAEADLDHIRPDLAKVLDRRALGLDEARPEAVAKRHAIKRRTARENVYDLVDEGTFVEYGPLTIAAQRARRTHEYLITRTPADGLVGGVGEIAGERCVVASYDYTVMAGTQGFHNHRKKDRIFDIAHRERLPVVLFAEGGGGRPGDTDYAVASGLDVTTFTTFARLSGLVPLVGVTGGRCFAGNAALLGLCDVIIATEDSNIGMGGPVMVEGGGLGVYRPEEIGPIDVQAPNGVVDLRVADDAEAVAMAKKYLSYFQGPVSDWEAPDVRALRHVVPENRMRAYDMRAAITGLADVDSVLELRREFAPGMITALIRVEGKPYGLVANNPMHLGGAIDAPGADKAARFMQLCDAFGLPLVFLCDTPGFMVGPESEETATVRHFSRMFIAGAGLSVPFGTVVTRKAYGLGSQSMAGGGFKAPLFTVSWPTGEFGPMGLEGAVRLSHRHEMEAIEDPAERQAYFERLVAELYERGSAVAVAEQFEFDDVIDPAETRRWISTMLAGPTRPERRRPGVDAW